MDARAAALALSLVFTSVAAAQGERVAVSVLTGDGAPAADAEVSALSVAETMRRWRERGRPVQSSDWWTAHEEHGERARTDADGRAFVGWVEGGLHLTAARPDAFAWARVEALPEEPVPLTLAPDRELALQAVGPDGRPRAGVEVLIARSFDEDPTPPAAQLWLPTGVVWTGLTSGVDGLARIPHVQLLLAQPELLSYAAGLGAPLDDPRLVELAPRALPDEPLRLELPPTGRLVVEMPTAPGARVRCRAVPPEDGGTFLRGEDTPWSPRAPGSVDLVDGRAEFPYVGLGLRLQLEARWDGMLTPAERVVDGPGRPNEVVNVDFEGREAPGGIEPRPDRATVYVGTREVEPSFVAMYSTSAANDAFRLCAQLPGDADSRREPWLRSRGERFESRGAHYQRVDPVYAHFCWRLEDRAEAEELASALGVPLALRVERPYRLEPDFSVERASFERGEEVAVTLTLRNAGEVPVALQMGGWQRGANRHARFSFEVERDGEEVTDASRNDNFGGIGFVRTLEPGEELVERAVLNRWADLGLPGDYVVRATYALELEGPPLPFTAEPFCQDALDDYTDQVAGEVRFAIR